MKKKQIPYNFLPIGIIDKPDSMDTMAFAKFEQEIEFLDDKRIVIKKVSPVNIWIFYLIIFSFFAFILYFSFQGDSLVFPIVVGILFLFIILWLYSIEFAERTNKYSFDCEFNRLEGTLTYTRLVRLKAKKELVKISFFNCEFYVESVHPRGSFKTIRYLSVINPSNKDISLMLKCKNENDSSDTMEDVFKIHSFLQWYMDKNRPLPPGKIFDEFRQRDYERRKADGFKKSTIGSFVRMNEYNGEPYAEDENEVLI